MGSSVKLFLAAFAISAVVGCSSGGDAALQDKAAPPSEGAVAAPTVKKNLPGAKGMAPGGAPVGNAAGVQPMTKPAGT